VTDAAAAGRGLDSAAAAFCTRSRARLMDESAGRFV
jgi:hypothetical protein